MRMRCEMHVNNEMRRVVMAARENETPQHLALKLAASLLFWEYKPQMDVSPKHPALLNQEFQPDLLYADECANIKLWIECGNTAMHKLGKLAKRIGDGRIIVLREGPHEAEQMREAILAEIERGDKVEILYWPKGEFHRWCSAIEYSNHIIGDTTECSLNIVMNEQMFCLDLEQL